MEGPPRKLQERVAQEISDRLLAMDPRVAAVRVFIRKPHIFLQGTVESVGEELAHGFALGYGALLLLLLPLLLPYLVPLCALYMQAWSCFGGETELTFGGGECSGLTSVCCSSKSIYWQAMSKCSCIPFCSMHLLGNNSA
jgi:hypothetical protein